MKKINRLNRVSGLESDMQWCNLYTFGMILVDPLGVPGIAASKEDYAAIVGVSCGRTLPSQGIDISVLQWTKKRGHERPINLLLANTSHLIYNLVLMYVNNNSTFKRRKPREPHET